MKSKHLSIALALIAAVGVGISVPFLISSTALGEQDSVKAEVPYCVTSPEIPARADFAGEMIDLTRYDLRERMDREQLAFTYMHTTTLLMIKRANRYFPVIEPILKANEIPDDFKYLMVIESSLNTLARSPAGAAGLWQFMPATGQEFGLEINKNVDERYHIEKSTKAACKYLKTAYTKYGNWLTVAASYNAGQGRISSELKNQLVDRSIDLWLVEETSRYMFRILAAKRVFQSPVQFGFLLKSAHLYPQIPCTEALVSGSIDDLPQFAKDKGVSYAQLKEANPWLREAFLTNKSGKNYLLNIPTQKGMNYDPQQTVAHDKRWVIDSK